MTCDLYPRVPPLRNSFPREVQSRMGRIETKVKGNARRWRWKTGVSYQATHLLYLKPSANKLPIDSTDTIQYPV